MEDRGSYWLSTAKQGSDEWKELRKGRTTASRVLEVILKPKSVHYQTPPNQAMIHGTEMEPIARQWYQEETGNQVEEVGIAIPKWDLRLGASSDGLVGDDGMIEIKCPLRMYDAIRTYFYLKDRGREGPNPVSPPHYAQIQMNLAVLDRDWCDYVVYTDNDKFIYRVNRDRTYWDKLYQKIKAVPDLGKRREPGQEDTGERRNP